MSAKQNLRDKLRKIEALSAGATTPGEKAAADAMAERFRQLLKGAPCDRVSALTADQRLGISILVAYAARCRNPSGKKPKS